MDVSLRQSCGV